MRKHKYYGFFAYPELKFFLLLLSVHIMLEVYSAVRHSPTPDEIAHVSSGLSHWQTADYSLYRVNPPLARMAASLPIYLLEKEHENWLKLYVDPGDFGRAEFVVGENFVKHYGTEYFNWIVWARVATIPFSVLGAVVCFVWARQLYGREAGWLAVWLWCFSPMVLAFGAIVTPDVPSASMGGLAMYLFWRWIRKSGFESLLLAGVGLGGAMLTKLTWVILPLVMLLLFFLRKLWMPRSEHFSLASSVGWMRDVGRLTGLFLIAWSVLMLGYAFQGTFIPIGEYRFQSHLLSGSSASKQNKSSNRFRGSIVENVPVPLPKQYLVGFDYHLADVDPGKKLAYLRGELREGGWWYYYLYALAVKCTLGGIALFLFASFYRFSSICRWPAWDEWVLLLPAFAVFVLLSYHTGLNKHSRYLLPLFPFLIVWASQCARIQSKSNCQKREEFCLAKRENNILKANAPYWFSDVGLKVAVTLCAAGSAFSSVYYYPHSMSYFNEAIGGPARGRFHLLNSNVDWGQDLYFLKDELSRRGWRSVGLATTVNYDVRIIGIAFFAPPVSPSAQIESQGIASKRLQPGVYAISACLLHGYPDSIPDGSGGWVDCQPHALSYFQEFEPVGMVGFSTLLFEISDDDIAHSKTWGREPL